MKASDVAADDLILLAQQGSYPDGTEYFDAWCPACAVFHRHGAQEGYRIEHCLDKKSLFAGKGYYLVLATNTKLLKSIAKRKARLVASP